MPVVFARLLPVDQCVGQAGLLPHLTFLALPKRPAQSLRLRLSERPIQRDLIFQFEGCDPFDGESVPGKFAAPLADALAVAQYFMQHGTISDPARWFEL